MLFEIEIKRLWKREGEEMVFVEPLSVEADGS
jgi:hypothetical protein